MVQQNQYCKWLLAVQCAWRCGRPLVASAVTVQSAEWPARMPSACSANEFDVSLVDGADLRALDTFPDGIILL